MTLAIVQRLRGLHALLEMALADERARRRPSDQVLSRIKKKKLQIRDRLAAMGAEPLRLRSY